MQEHRYEDQANGAGCSRGSSPASVFLAQVRSEIHATRPQIIGGRAKCRGIAGRRIHTSSFPRSHRVINAEVIAHTL